MTNARSTRSCVLSLAGLALVLAACSPADNPPPASTPVPGSADTEHLDVIRDAELRTEPEIDDYHRAAPAHKEDPEPPPELPRPDDPLPRLEGDPAPVPAAEAGYDGPYRGESSAGDRSSEPVDADPPADD